MVAPAKHPYTLSVRSPYNHHGYSEDPEAFESYPETPHEFAVDWKEWAILHARGEQPALEPGLMVTGIPTMAALNSVASTVHKHFIESVRQRLPASLELEPKPYRPLTDMLHPKKLKGKLSEMGVHLTNADPRVLAAMKNSDPAMPSLRIGAWATIKYANVETPGMALAVRTLAVQAPSPAYGKLGNGKPIEGAVRILSTTEGREQNAAMLQKLLSVGDTALKRSHLHLLFGDASDSEKRT